MTFVKYITIISLYEPSEVERLRRMATYTDPNLPKKVDALLKDDAEMQVRAKYPQAFAVQGRFWRILRNPAGVFDGTYLGAAVTKRGAWEKAWKNIQSGPQCCFPHPLDFVICDKDGNTLEIEH